MTDLLELRDVRVSYGKIEALRGISLRVREGEVVALIGSNGAGKTTTLRAISGTRRPSAGTIVLAGQLLDGLPAHDIVSRGISLAPEGRRIFARMSVRENLAMGAYLRHRDRTVTEDFDRVFALFPLLEQRAGQAGGTLSGGEQQMLAIGRALMARPRVLMLDEPSLGVAPQLTARIYDTLAEISRQGTTILLVEQNAAMALKLAHRGYVLETGEIVLEDTADNLLRSEQVRKAYLGET